jgi:hypothetical protein
MVEEQKCLPIDPLFSEFEGRSVRKNYHWDAGQKNARSSR